METNVLANMADVEVSSVDFSFNSDETIAGLSAKQISLKISDLDQVNRNLRLEIELLGDHLKKLDRSAHAKLHTIPAHKDGLSSTSFDACALANTSFGSSSKFPRRMSKSRSSISDRFTKLSINQKLSILQKECNDLEREKRSSDMKNNKMLDGLDAVLKEAALNVAILEKEEHDLNAKVLPLFNQNSGDVHNYKKLSKKFIRYFREKLKAKRTYAANLILENSYLKTQLKKLKVDVKQEEELGDAISRVDFDKMEIENLLFSRQVEERNNEMAKLKNVSNSANQNLNNTKKKLTGISEEYQQVTNDLNLRVRLINRLTEEHSRVVMEKEGLVKENDRLKKLMDEFEVPGVSRYMECNKEKVELQNMIRIWTRKVEVAKIMLTSSML